MDWGASLSFVRILGHSAYFLSIFIMCSAGSVDWNYRQI